MVQSAFAVAASAWGVLMGLAPLLQIRRMLREQSSRDISLAYFAILLAGFALWIGYGTVARNLALVIPNSIALLTGAALVITTLRLRGEIAVRPAWQAGYAAGVADGDAVDWRGLNRASWDDRVPVHLASEFYDLDGFRRGAGSLRPFEAAEAGDMTGKRLVHLQCHVGLDTLSWARNGALVTGLDFSEPAIEAARSLAADLAIDASFVVADVYDAVTALGGRRFDVVYTGTGALVWLPDIPRWAGIVAALLEPGGFLYLVEGHPFAQVLDDAEGTNIVRDYFDDRPRVEDYPYTYTDGPALKHTRSVEFQHGLGQIVTALADAGLRIDFLNEHDFDAFQRFESLERRDGQYRFPAGRPRVPMMFSLRATRPA